jgi:hypothetical protein
VVRRKRGKQQRTRLYFNMDQHDSENRVAFLALLGTQHKPEEVTKRGKEILDLLESAFPTSKTSLMALAMAEAADKILFATFKRAQQKQEAFAGHLKRIVRGN